MTATTRLPHGAAQRRPWPARPFPVWALLIGAYPVLFLFAENIAEVQLRDVIPPLGRGLILAALLLLVASLLLRDLRRGAIVSGALLVACFGYGHVAELATPAGVSRDLLLAGWALLLVVAVLAAVLLRERWVARLTSALDVIVGILVLLALTQVVPVEVSRTVSAAEVPGRAGGDRPVAAPGSRDVWYFVFDRYGSETSLEALGGIDNDLPEWLEVHGFQVARHAHANYGRTAMSMAATLNLAFLDDVAAKMGPASKDMAPVNEQLQDHWVGRFLQERGYRYVHLGSWFGATKTARIADVSGCSCAPATKLPSDTNACPTRTRARRSMRRGAGPVTTFGTSVATAGDAARIPRRRSASRASTIAPRTGSRFHATGPISSGSRTPVIFATFLLLAIHLTRGGGGGAGVGGGPARGGGGRRVGGDPPAWESCIALADQEALELRRGVVEALTAKAVVREATFFHDRHEAG